MKRFFKWIWHFFKAEAEQSDAQRDDVHLVRFRSVAPLRRKIKPILSQSEYTEHMLAQLSVGAKQQKPPRVFSSRQRLGKSAYGVGIPCVTSNHKSGYSAVSYSDSPSILPYMVAASIFSNSGSVTSSDYGTSCDCSDAGGCGSCD